MYIPLEARRIMHPFYPLLASSLDKVLAVVLKTKQQIHLIWTSVAHNWLVMVCFLWEYLNKRILADSDITFQASGSQEGSG